MKLDIREQPRLPLRRQIEICAEGIAHRLLRATITLVVVALAVAFLTNVLIEGLIVESLRGRIAKQEAQARSLDRLIETLSAPASDRMMIQQLATLVSGQPEDRLLQRWFEIDAAAWRTLTTQAREVQTVLNWLDDLNPGLRRSLVSSSSSIEALTALSSSQLQDEFIARATGKPQARSPLVLRQVVPTVTDFHTTVQLLVEAHRARLHALRQDPQALAWIESLRGQDSSIAPEEVDAILKRHAIALDANDLQSLRQETTHRTQATALVTALRDPSLPAAWRQALGNNFDHTEALATLAAQPAAASLIASRWDASHGDASVVTASAQRLLDARRAQETRARITAAYGDQPGLRGGVLWLIIISMLVCAVGVTNAMLMSVLERMREIATMKCLGGVDSLIGSLFLMEAAFLGGVGGTAGALLGFLVGAARMAGIFGSWAITSMPWLHIALGCVGAATVGVLVTTLSAAFPAMKAAGLPPMEAMRVS